MRRGMAAETAVVVVVVFAIVMVILAILYTALFDVGSKEFSKSQCQASVLLSGSVQEKAEFSKGWLCVQAVPNPVPLKCSRRFVTVTPDDVLKDGKSVRLEYNPVCPDVDPSARLVEISADAEKASDIVSVKGACMEENVLAKEMANCWNMFLEGETPVFRNIEEESNGWFNDNLNQKACFVCSEVTLASGKDVRGFVDYLKSKEYILDRSYYEYLARSKKAICNQKVRDLSPDGTCWAAYSGEVDLQIRGDEWPGVNQTHFPDGHTYAVTFVRQGMERNCQLDSDQSDIPTMTVQIIPAENIGEYCDVVLA